MTIDHGPRWYVAQTQPRAEAKAALHLNRQGFEVYVPRYLKRRRHARKVESVAAPLFPSYLFVAFDIAVQRWRSIHSTIGVSRLVCNGEDPAPIADAIIEGLKVRQDANGLIRLDPRPRFARGDKIRVLDGAFTDCLGLFEGMDDRQRIAILLELLGRKVRVFLDPECVAAA
jgi:transcriptional antiterminator RfaH